MSHSRPTIWLGLDATETCGNITSRHAMELFLLLTPVIECDLVSILYWTYVDDEGRQEIWKVTSIVAMVMTIVEGSALNCESSRCFFYFELHKNCYQLTLSERKKNRFSLKDWTFTGTRDFTIYRVQYLPEFEISTFAGSHKFHINWGLGIQYLPEFLNLTFTRIRKFYICRVSGIQHLPGSSIFANFLHSPNHRGNGRNYYELFSTIESIVDLNAFWTF